MGTQFDPKAGNAGGDTSAPSGEYLVALVWFERRRNKAKTADYLRGKYEVVSGDQAGKTFFANQSLDLTTAAGRLSVWCASVGHEEPFDLDDDKAIRRAFLNRPFRATVERAEKGGYVNHDIKRMTVAAKLTDAERKAIEGWVLDREQERATSGKSDDEDDETDDIPF